MRNFKLARAVDETGVSGTGNVAEGTIFSSGQVVIKWLTATSSIGFYDNIQALEAIHGHGGKTVVVYDDGAPPAPTLEAAVENLVVSTTKFFEEIFSGLK
jgi:hypothetical protein